MILILHIVGLYALSGTFEANHVYLRSYWLGVSIRPPVRPSDACPNGYRYMKFKYEVEDFIVYLGQSWKDADAVLKGSPSGGLTLQRPGASEHLTITRTFFPPDNFNLLFIGLLVHGPPSVTIVVDSTEDPHRETVGLLLLSL